MNPGHATALIQPFGFHVGFSDQLRVVAVSSNIGQFVEGVAAGALLGQPMTTLASPDAVHEIRNRMALLRSDQASDQLFGCALRDDGPAFDISVRRLGDGFSIDAEPAVRTGGDAMGILAAQLNSIADCADLAILAKRAADGFRALTGADRVTVFLAGSDPVNSARSGQAVEAPDRAPPGAATVADAAAQPVGIEADSTPRLDVSELAHSGTAMLDWLRSTNARSGLMINLPDEMGAISCLHATPRQVALERRCIGRMLARLIAMQALIIQKSR